MEARVEIIRKLDIYTPSTQMRKGMAEVTHSKYGKYFTEPHDDFVEHHSYHFPIILMKDGSPWSDANRYLLHKLKGIMPTSHRTLDSVARDLSGFRRWLDSEEIDYLTFTKRVVSRPTYLFCGHLHDKIREKQIAITTAKKIMCTIQGFYRWLINEGHKFEYALWRENDSFILFKDSHGFNRSKSITSTDLSTSFRFAKNSNNYDEYIQDGGKLRPLPKEQQQAVVRALKQIGNTEMRLSFLISLTSGARLQTVFTLRVQLFEKKLPFEAAYRTIKVGGTTYINTKFNKQQVITIPTWLYRQVQIYLKSERYLKRAYKSQYVYIASDQQYVFLSRNGQPYYLGKNDPFAVLYRNPPRGNGITQFIRQQIQPLLKSQGHNFKFRFHDLRASFGMNLLEQKINDEDISLSSDRNSPEFFRVLMFVKERMGHSRLSTTMNYLDYKSNSKLAIQVQDKFELYLQKLMKE